MAKPRDDRQKDLLRPALEAIIDLGHPLVRLARAIDWQFLDGRFAGVCTAGAGQPPLPTRLVAGLFILKHMHDLSDEGKRSVKGASRRSPAGWMIGGWQRQQTECPLGA